MKKILVSLVTVALLCCLIACNSGNTDTNAEPPQLTDIKSTGELRQTIRALSASFAYSIDDHAVLVPKEGSFTAESGEYVAVKLIGGYNVILNADHGLYTACRVFGELALCYADGEELIRLSFSSPLITTDQNVEEARAVRGDAGGVEFRLYNINAVADSYTVPASFEKSADPKFESVNAWDYLSVLDECLTLVKHTESTMSFPDSLNVSTPYQLRAKVVEIVKNQGAVRCKNTVYVAQSGSYSTDSGKALTVEVTSEYKLTVSAVNISGKEASISGYISYYVNVYSPSRGTDVLLLVYSSFLSSEEQIDESVVKVVNGDVLSISPEGSGDVSDKTIVILQSLDNSAPFDEDVIEIIKKSLTSIECIGN